MLGKLGAHARQNLVAYIALFFALGLGTAWAAGPLKPGDSAGGDLAGTYPNPAIGVGVIAGGSGGKIVDDSVTGDDIRESSVGKVPDADRLDGLDSSAFAPGFVFGGGSVSNSGPNPAQFASLSGLGSGREATTEVVVPSTLTTQDFYFSYRDSGAFRFTATPATFTFAVRRDGADMGVSCSMKLREGESGTCQDADAITASAGDRLSMQVTCSCSFQGEVRVGWRAV